MRSHLADWCMIFDEFLAMVYFNNFLQFGIERSHLRTQKQKIHLHLFQQKCSSPQGAVSSVLTGDLLEMMSTGTFNSSYVVTPKPSHLDSKGIV